MFHERARLCINTAVVIPKEYALYAFFFSLSAYLSVYIQYIYNIYICTISFAHMHQHAHQPQHGWRDETPHPFLFQLPTVLLEEERCEKEEVELSEEGLQSRMWTFLFAQAGQLRSQGLSCYICSQLQP